MPSIAYLECSRCHAHVSPATPQTVCPACGAVFAPCDGDAAEVSDGERDHRGVLLPRKSRVGGIITPQ